MEEDYLSSAIFGEVMGISGGILCTRINKCFRDVQSTHKAVFYSLNSEEMTGNAKNYYEKTIVGSIKEDKPVLLLIGSKIITFNNEEHKQSKCKYHWVTVTDVCTDYYTGDTLYTIVSWGNKYTLTADEFFDNIGFLSGMMLFD